MTIKKKRSRSKNKSQDNASPRSNKSFLRNNTKDDKIIVFGRHSCFSILLNKNRIIHQIFITKNIEQNFELFLSNNNLSSNKFKINIVDNKYLDNLVNENNHQGIVIITNYLKIDSQFGLLKLLNKNQNIKNILILDQITDPHNVGSIIRSAVAFDFKIIIFCSNNSIIENSIILKTSAGAFEKTSLFIASNLNDLISKLKKLDFWCISLSGDGNNKLCDLDNLKKKAVIIGSEGRGIRKLVKQNSDFICKINISSDVESLNVSNACAIALYQLSNLNQ